MNTKRVLLAFIAIAATTRAVAVESSVPKPQTVRVAAIQCSSDLGKTAENTVKLTALITQAAGHGAKIVVLPEAAITGYLSQDLKTNWHTRGRPIETAFVGLDPAKYAENIPGPSTKYFCDLAKQCEIYLTIPVVEVDLKTAPAKPTYYNSVCLANPRGELVAYYRKLTPWPYPEKSWASPGDRGTQTYDTEYGRVGLAICFDIHTILEKYQDRHLWALLYSIAWVDDEHPAEWFFERLPERVRPFKIHVIGANWSVDQKQKWRGYGFSEIISNQGTVVAAAKRLYGSEIVYADLPTDSLSQP